jgi:heme-degrading monooxygenase HmoA
MIERTWRGTANIDNANRYIEHLKTDTFPKVRNIPGNMGAKVLRRTLDVHVEFLVVTTWASMDAIKAFAGGECCGGSSARRSAGSFVEIRYYC